MQAQGAGLLRPETHSVAGLAMTLGVAGSRRECAGDVAIAVALAVVTGSVGGYDVAPGMTSDSSRAMGPESYRCKTRDCCGR